MPRPIAKNYGEKRSHILKQAAKVFAEQGFDRATMAQLGTACGISKGNIYHYYDGKEALLFDILDSYLSGLRDRICGLDISDLPAEKQFHALVLETLIAYEGADHQHRIQSKGFGMLPKAEQARLKNYQRDIIGCFSTTLQKVAPEIFANDKARLHATTMSVFGMLNWYYMWNSKATSKARREYAKTVSALTLHGITGG